LNASIRCVASAARRTCVGGSCSVRALFGLGLFQQAPRTLQRGTAWHGASHEDKVAGEWLNWCTRWRSTSALSPRTRRSYQRTLFLAGRWLAEARPEVCSPEHWTRSLAAEYVAALDRTTVGQWGNTFALDAAAVGKPIAARTKECRLTAVRVFFRDLQECGWIPRRFDPRRDLATPRDVRRLIGPDPRVIADDVWAKLLSAGMNLNPDDLRVPRSGIVAAYSLNMLRALAVVWLFAGLRRNEIRRLRVFCIRWQRNDVVVAGADEVLPKDAVCLLDVPVQKTGLAFTKPVDRVVGEAIAAWECERPEQPALFDRKTAELVPFLFACRGRPIGEAFLNTTLIPAICRKAGFLNVMLEVPSQAIVLVPPSPRSSSIRRRRFPSSNYRRGWATARRKAHRTMLGLLLPDSPRRMRMRATSPAICAPSTYLSTATLS